MEEQPKAAPPQWKADLSVREQIQIAHAVEYTRTFSESGVPGHGQFLLIAKLAQKLDALERASAKPE
jgi:hypothetical protein